MSTIHIYTDGSSRGNPGPGGFGVILMYNNHRKEISKGYRLTTNNRMELLAVITGLEAITKKELPVVVYSDSQYVVKAIEAKNYELATEAYKKAVPVIDRIADKGVIHKNKAARHKSRLNKAIKALKTA